MRVGGLTAPVVSTAVRSRPRLAVAFLTAALLAVGAGACRTETPTNQELTEALVASGLSEEVASCTADAVLETLSDDEVRLLVERGAGGAPRDDPGDDDDSADRLRRALDECRALRTEEQATTTTTEP